MARNQHAGRCYVCGLRVEAGTGHFERHKGGWRVKHAIVAGHGRVTCKMASPRVGAAIACAGSGKGGA